jgi:hypothetical protein
VQRQSCKIAPAPLSGVRSLDGFPVRSIVARRGQYQFGYPKYIYRPGHQACTTPLTHVSRDERGLEEKQYSFAGAHLRLRQSAMVTISKVIHIEPAFHDPGFVQEMFERHAPCRTMAGYLRIKALGTFLPLVQRPWAANGETLVAGAVIEPPARSPPGELRIPIRVLCDSGCRASSERGST